MTQAQQTKGVVTTSVRTPADLAARLTAQGWRVGIVSGAPTKAEALAAIGKALDVPSYYGRNLDALTDCLRDLEAPTALIWVGWEPFAVSSPSDWGKLVTVLSDRVAEEGTLFSVLFCVGTPETDLPSL